VNTKRVSILIVLCLVLAGLTVFSYQRPARSTFAQGPDEFPGLPLPTDHSELFSGSGRCVACHTNMVDQAGQDVSIDMMWRSTMMANAARDPYWLAIVRAEINGAPHLKEIIEDKCTTCHMPMARTTVHLQDQPGLMFDDGFLNPDNSLHALAMDGVSCTVCHQVEADRLGTPESFSGGYVINPDYPQGERPSYSQFDVSPALSAMMVGASGYIPVQAEHTGQAELCAACHTLYTPYIDNTGEVVGEFPEQTPYLEWQHSDFAPSLPCQGCHMPTAQGTVVTSITGGPPREPFFQHAFVGGNAYIQAIFAAFGDEMGTTAGSEHFTATRDRTLHRLQNLTAVMTIDSSTLVDSNLEVAVTIRPLTGHKFPSGFPSRRAFIRFTVLDRDGAVIFESGAYEANGFIHGDDHDADPLRYEPHYTTITSPDQVQIYETVMGDVDGLPTTTLLRGARYLKDNRLLPKGFDKDTAGEDIATRGGAVDDVDFVGGSDQIVYRVDIGDSEGPFTVKAELLYLSIGHNWAEKLRSSDSTEAGQFLTYYDAVPNTPVLVAAVTGQIE